MGVPTACVTPAFTSGGMGELTLADTRPLACPWPAGQLNSPNALRVDTAQGLWSIPAGFAKPASSSTTAPLGVLVSSQGGMFTGSGVSLPTGTAVYQPSASDPAFTTGPSAAVSNVTLTNPSQEMSMGFTGWAEWFIQIFSGSSNWIELWGLMTYPGSQWPNVAGNLDSIASIAPNRSSAVSLRCRRGVCLVIPPVSAGGSAVIDVTVGAKNVTQTGGTTAGTITGWTWKLWGTAYVLDPVGMG